MTTIELQQWREASWRDTINKIDDMEISEELGTGCQKRFFSKRKDTPALA